MSKEHKNHKDKPHRKFKGEVTLGKKIRSKWSKGDEVKDNGDIGELIIDGNDISFHIDGTGDIFSNTYVANLEHHYYKVFTYGQESSDDRGYFYRVSKAFEYNGSDYKEFAENIDGITSVSFEIPELVDWLNINSVKLDYDELGLIIRQLKIKSVVIKDKEPNISIGYETKLPLSGEWTDIELTLRNAPRIFIEYDKEVDDIIVTNDICKIMRFFGLLIGRISYADDIRLKLSGKNMGMRLFINNDFSYNYHSNAYWMRHRTKFENIYPNIQQYFEKWYKFSNDEGFNFLQNAFFSKIGKHLTTAEDLFLTYCKFLEGYDLRISEDENKADNLYKKLCDILKSEEAKRLFSKSFEEADSSYKSKVVAGWISTGFLGRIGLQDRLKRLDEKFLKIVSANSNNAIGIDDANQFFSKITKTRNYYSHFKPDDSGMLNFSEMYRTIEILEALVVTILLSETGMPIDNIKDSMVVDELYWPLLTHQREGRAQKIDFI